MKSERADRSEALLVEPNHRGVVFQLWLEHDTAHFRKQLGRETKRDTRRRVEFLEDHVQNVIR